MAIKVIQYKNRSFKIAYNIKNPKQTETILFLHGWGSNKELMEQAFGDFMSDMKQIYIDLPGFGKSSNEVALTTDDYAKITAIFLKAMNVNEVYAAGHSFGGKVALLLHPKRLILLSSAGIPMPKSFKVKSKIALFKLLKPFRLQKIRELFVSKDAINLPPHMYETFKNVVNEDFSDKFASFTNPTLLCWGQDDKATPLKAAQKILSLMKNAKLYIFKGDHYFFLHNKKEVAQKLEEFCHGLV